LDVTSDKTTDDVLDPLAVLDCEEMPKRKVMEDLETVFIDELLIPACINTHSNLSEKGYGIRLLRRTTT
jgi:hypothetical protein